MCTKFDSSNEYDIDWAYRICMEALSKPPIHVLLLRKIKIIPYKIKKVFKKKGRK